MKRSNTRKKPSRKYSANSPTPESRKKPMSRRDMLGLAKFGAIGLAVFGGGGWYFTSKVMAGIAEADLSKLGNGMPTIVQIHDPGCPMCNRLQNATRSAIGEFPDGEIQYLVANIKDTDGRGFAQKYGVSHVTLLLFDGQGKRVGTLTGVRTAEELTATFRRYLAEVKAKTG